MPSTSTMPERVGQVTPQEEALAPGPAEGLAAALWRARRAEGDARRAAATEFNGLLDELSLKPSRALADALLKWLDEGVLGDVEDSDGYTARAAAAGALLSMGYPYALEISPDDLDHLRERSASGRASGGMLAAALIVAVTCGYGALGLWGAPDGLTPSHLAALAAVTLSMLFAAVGRRVLGRRGVLLPLLVSGAMTLSLAFSQTALVLPGLGALAAFGMAWPRRR